MQNYICVMDIQDNLDFFKNEIPEHVTLVAVSKTKPIEDLQVAYEAGQRIFGENRVQEMAEKQGKMPDDAQWHMIGHVQRNKVKYMAEFVTLVHSVDSPRLCKAIDKEAAKHDRIIDCLLQVHIAEEESKYGFDDQSLFDFIYSPEFEGLKHIRVRGLMGMATLTDDQHKIRNEFRHLKKLYDLLKSDEKLPSGHQVDILSMGMTGDYKIAIDEGANMVRIGSAIFGKRD